MPNLSIGTLTQDDNVIMENATMVLQASLAPATATVSLTLLVLYISTVPSAPSVYATATVPQALSVNAAAMVLEALLAYNTAMVPLASPV